ncbi:ATP-dependent RecD-like DNA helicase [Alitiscatomonas aceti]|uniref:ATP-dependent RecD2 DNA helicase n=1 Tax=Alitiscatomonas aceti TaxID=2981724 RepID=A0ABT2V113_9FIRM|nr:ATP-dependent RecD-like DNA helicase [Alitiscatomonas aceti]MCU6800580.1 ATP-dependent RecD-like DNA helicase [Alitiscatomonas aceti]
MATVTGYVEKIKYRNDENGYSVLSVADGKEEYVLVGTFAYIAEGERIEATGRMVEHSIYGEQLSVESYEIKPPEDTLAIERYLGSGAIKGIGAALAKRIVKKFKADTFRIIEEEPERLSEVKGISERMAMEISSQVEEKRELRQAMLFLQQYGIHMNLAVKIYQQYGQRMYSVIQENPYQLADDIHGVGFKIADEIAAKVGIFTDSDYRIRSGMFYALLQAVGNGHTYLPREELFASAAELLKVDADYMEKHLMDLQMEKKLVVKEKDGGMIVYPAQFYYMELNTARMLHDLNIRDTVPPEKIRKRLESIVAGEQIELDVHQEEAVIEAVNNGLLIITGGPGTGKTTTINTIIRYFEQEDMEILLAAPTGRAAKRMAEATGYEARTIHRLLELTGAPSMDSGRNGNGSTGGETRLEGMHFERNEANPLDADVVIIDEVSMVDISLMHSLLKAVNVGTRLILVGDVNQLPSVGPGNVLRDMIQSGKFPVVMLTKIFRQAAQSDIIVNAHKINAGERVPLGKRSRDFLFIRRDNPAAIIKDMMVLLRDKLPGYVGAEIQEIQIMTPMRKGALGVEQLNRILQENFNPPAADKPEKEAGGTIFRTGDKVMQIKNNYQLAWEVRNRYGIPVDKGEGVFNGDMGVIRQVNAFSETLEVEFDEGRMVEYSFKQLEELELAYAITIHKSQGSEYPAVVIPIYSGPRMLMTRNLIYTAVTRAKKCVCLVGLPEMFQFMVENEMEQKRYSGLKDRILEIGPGLDK